MSLEEAYKLLGLDADCGLADVKSAFHRLSLKHHPDSAGEDGTIQKRLKEARDLLQSTFGNRQLVPMEVKREIEKLERGLLSQQASAQAIEYVALTKRRRTIRLQKLKYAALILAAISAAFGWLSTSDVTAPGGFQTPVISLSNFLEFFPSREMFLFLAKRAAFAFGVLAGILQLLVNHQTYLVESWKEDLGDEENCLQTLHYLGRVLLSRTKPFSAQDIINFRVENRDLYDQNRVMKRLFPRFVRIFERWFVLDIDQKVRLTILKSVEHGILENMPATKRLYRYSADYDSAKSNS